MTPSTILQQHNLVGPCRHKPAPERCMACILDASDYFQNLSLDAKLALQQHLKHATFRRREQLYQEGAPSNSLFILISGRVKVYKSVFGGRQQIHKLVLVPGDLVACEDLYLDKYDSTAEAIDNVAVCGLKKNQLFEVAARHPQVPETIMRTMARNLNLYIRHVASLGQKTALERVASYLRFLSDTHPGSPLDREVLTEPLTRGEVADMLGITQRTLIRSLKKLEADQVIGLAKEGFIIRNRAALVQISEGG